MFRTRRALEGINSSLTRLDGRFGELLEEMRKQHELDREVNRREHEKTRASNRLDHEQTRGSFAQVNREILLELRDHRTILERIDHGVQANTQGLLHVLDELRSGRGGPGTAPAA